MQGFAEGRELPTNSHEQKSDPEWKEFVTPRQFGTYAYGRVNWVMRRLSPGFRVWGLGFRV